MALGYFFCAPSFSLPSACILTCIADALQDAFDQEFMQICDCIALTPAMGACISRLFASDADT